MIRIILVAGARPNFMKVAPLAQEMMQHPDQFDMRIVHTGQHFDVNMSEVFFKDLGIPAPDVHFGIVSGSHAEQTAKIMVEFEGYCIKKKPDLVVVVGDVNSTLACASVAKKLCLRLAHVEAGLRSFDRTMPEEINRIVTDSIADLLFVSEPSGIKNLLKEGHNKSTIYHVGNIMIDTLLFNLDKINKNNKETIREKYALVTLHRPSNVDNKRDLERILNILRKISNDIPILFPVHPRTLQKINDFGLFKNLQLLEGRLKSLQGITLTPPLGYLYFLELLKNSAVCLTDSGGIQEETTVLGVPCLTLRDNTERPITVNEGTNTLVGMNENKISTCINQILSGKYKRGKIPEYWDGQTARRIIDILKKQTLSS